MRRQLMSVAAGLAMTAGTFLAATPAWAEPEAGLVLHGCVITAGEDYLLVRVSGGGAGPRGVVRVQTGGVPNYDPETTADACGAIVVYQEDGVWYAESITVTRDESGQVETERRTRSRPTLR